MAATQTVPEQCTVLVVGGGPAGSYASSALAREGISVVLLEADNFPRYHIGESMLPSMRHFLKFIDCYEKFDAHGFRVKNGGAFRLNWSRPESYTDFVAAGGPGGYSWNVIRSEADEILFRHAGESGASIFDGTKVTGIEFEASSEDVVDPANPNPGKPVSATWSRKDGSTGTVKFDYLIDASGRAGLVSTKYLKNRRYNQGLKNVASWAYWTGGGTYGVGTHKVGAPGWVWFIPLHNGTHSVGIVMNQAKATERKKAMDSPSSKEFYLENLNLVPGIQALLEKGEIVSEVKSASDWSYSASSYAFPHVRIAGDAGCFIDPFFSSGVHLALSSGLTAAVTISAAIRGDVTEKEAAQWHSSKVAEGYTRFLLVVLSSLKQIRGGDEPVLSDWDEKSFDRAFDHFRPIIQGTADADSEKKLSTEEISKTIDFCFRAFAHVPVERKDALLEKMKNHGVSDPTATDLKTREALEELKNTLSPEELDIMNTIRGRRMIRAEDSLNIDNYRLDSINGMAPNLERGNLTLRKAEINKIDVTKKDLLSLLSGEAAEGVHHETEVAKAPAAAVVEVAEFAT
ncbi:hypothetical protein PENARI_c007G03087 [Penicillium arizonense]|uniref:FAD-binding domain-containing protein n=1 Tax=Penicillium arizonense TaxID=1835702 RepID=A0A1F5LKU8_PENAI|nr:hypothetical protein PENARI_c007G03087 [Penicillium arizonense]OGE53726.1 hypothetical protein PENARI_c007G03087 [Penicillium arizonense]